MENRTGVDELMMELPASGFSDRAIARALIEEILDLARRAPSGVNTQPWNVYVLQGQSRARLVELATGTLPALLIDAAAQSRFRSQCDLQPGTGTWPARGQLEAGEDFLSDVFAAACGKPPQAKAQAELARYFRFFDAPVGLMFTVSRSLGLGSVLDYGMFLQNIRLAARARGLQTCVQGGWKGLADKVLPHLDAPEDMLLLGGMALGYGDNTQPPVELPGDLLAVDSFTTWHS